MKKFLLLFIVASAFSYSAIAQIKPIVKTDTSHIKPGQPGAPGDSLHVKFPLNLSTNKFDKIDNADLELTPAVPIERYGVVDTADLKMTSCDFEKDANAMVLFDRGEMAMGVPEVIVERQRRIKIFNEDGKSEANIRIEFNNKFGAERILGIEAETINLVNGKIEYSKLDPKLVYAEHTNKQKDAVVFSMPNVKAGSIIEYRYAWAKQFSRNFPAWDFQCNLPIRYSQLQVVINPMLEFSVYTRKNHPFVRDTLTPLGHVWALADIASIKEERFMRSANDVRQDLTFIITAVKAYGQTNAVVKSWEELGKQIANYKDFTKPFDQSRHDEDELVKQTKALSNNDQKVAFLFDKVKTAMKWNEQEEWFSIDGIKSAWKKKSGNWGEINMILCRLLREAGINAYPMLVSTRDNGLIVPDFVNFYQINKLVTYVPVDSTKYYVLDATDKYNVYNEVPFNLLNSYGLYLNKEKEDYRLVFMKKETPVKQLVLITAAINADGTMNGTAQISSHSYNKSNTLELHKKLDEKEYKEYLTDNDNNLKIDSLTLEDAEVDSLPLTQNIKFRLDLPGTDEKYIYFNPNLFTSLHNNPFISKDRVSDIDFGCNNLLSISGRYKIPAGYKVDVLPKSLTLLMADKSISFKRLIGEQDGDILISYVINYKKSVFPQASYPDIYQYFKKMTEMLNEQIVLKKSG